jgi:tetratricopeptide (TPR) repeat protein
VAKAVLRWLKEKSSWLLIIDNLDDISIAHGYLPELGGGNHHVLITTRNRDTTGIPAQGLEVEVFDSSHAINLLLLRTTGTKQCQPEIRLQATKIVEELGYLPLAVEHAAAFIRQSSLDLSKFLDMFSKSRKEFLENLPGQNHTYSRAVAATLMMSFKKVEEEEDVDAAELLTLFAFLNPDGILIDFLQDGHGGVGERLGSLISNPFKFGKALGKLGEFSLIRQSKDGRTIAIHRLVQAVIQDNIGPDLTKKVTDATISLFLSAFPPFDEDQRQIHRKYQAQILGPLQSLFESGTVGIAEMSLRLAAFLNADGNASAGEQFGHIAVKINTKMLGTDNSRTLIAMNNLAETYWSLGQVKEAAELHEKVLEAMQRKLGMEHPDTLNSMNNLAGTYWSLGQVKEAAELHEKVLEARQRKLGMDHPDTLSSMNNLAGTYRSLGRMKEAQELHAKVLEARQRKLGMEHPNTLNSMNNLAATYGSLGQVKEAAELHEKVLEARQRKLGMEHPDTLNSMNNLAETYRSLGQVKEAAELHEKALEARQRKFGTETSVSMFNLATTYWTLSRHEDAIRLYQAELTQCRTRYGDLHEKTINSLRNLIKKYREIGRFEEANRLEEELP